LIGCNSREKEPENDFFLHRSAAILEKKPVPKTLFLQISLQKNILKQLPLVLSLGDRNHKLFAVKAFSLRRI